MSSTLLRARISSWLRPQRATADMDWGRKEGRKAQKEGRKEGTRAEADPKEGGREGGKKRGRVTQMTQIMKTERTEEEERAGTETEHTRPAERAWSERSCREADLHIEHARGQSWLTALTWMQTAQRATGQESRHRVRERRAGSAVQRAQPSGCCACVECVRAEQVGRVRAKAGR